MADAAAGIRRARPSDRLGVIWIDAHADIHSPFTTPSGNMHGMPLAIAAAHDNLPEAINDPDTITRQFWRQLQELGGSQGPALDLGDLIYIAVRDTEPAEDATLASHAIPVVRTEQVRRDGPDAAAPRVCCWEICEINPHLDTLNTLAEVSLRIFNSGLEQLAERLTAPGGV
jgi:arginase family enzyme